MRKGYDYIKSISEHLTEDKLVDLFACISVLNEQPVCKDWIELISAVSVEGMLNLSKSFGGRSFTIPEFYQILVVYSALCVIELSDTYSYYEAKKKVIGGLELDGFDELVNKIKSTASSIGRVKD